MATSSSSLPAVRSYALDIPEDPEQKAEFDQAVADIFFRISGRFPTDHRPAPPAKPRPKRKEREEAPEVAAEPAAQEVERSPVEDAKAAKCARTGDTREDSIEVSDSEED